MDQELIPAIAGRWRQIDVRIGSHVSPSFAQIAPLMRDYFLDLQARIEAVGAALDELTLECLAFAEGRLLSIHPFPDLNGRVTRVFLAELLRRLGLPPVDPTPTEAERPAYLEALGAADQMNCEPLTEFWRRRVERGEWIR